MRRDGSGQASVPSVVCYFCVMRSDRHFDPFDGTLGEDEVPLFLQVVLEISQEPYGVFVRFLQKHLILCLFS